jgi:hypothetical protein
MTRLLAALLLCATSLSAAVATLNFNVITGGTEEIAKVITFADLVANPPITGLVGYRIQAPIIQGTLFLRPLGSSAAGTEVVNGDVLNSSNEVVWTPPLNLSGDGCDAFNVVGVNGSGVVLSTMKTVRVDLANTYDPLTLSSGTFVQPEPGTKVTEDTAYTFTWSQLTEVLGAGANVDPIQLRVTAALSGSFSSPLPIVLTAGQSLTWTPSADAFTYDNVHTFEDEPPIAAFRVVAENIGGANPTTAVTFSTPILGVRETVAADDTIDSVDPLVVVRGIPTEFTYEQLKAKLHGYTDIDRDATLEIDLTAAGITGMTVWKINSGIADEYPVIPLLFGPNSKLRILVPETQSTGTYAIASFTADANYPDNVVVEIPAPHPTLVVQSASSGGGGGASSASGGGGCGAGMIGGLLILSGLAFLRKRSAVCAR